MLVPWRVLSFWNSLFFQGHVLLFALIHAGGWKTDHHYSNDDECYDYDRKDPHEIMQSKHIQDEFAADQWEGCPSTD